MSSFLINIIAFKIAWLASVLGGANELPLLGPAAVIVAVAIHLRLVKEPSREMLLIFSTGLFCDHSSSYRVRITCTTGLTQGCNMVDVDA